MDYHNESFPQPQKASQSISEIYNEFQKFYGCSLEDISSQAGDEETAYTIAIDVSEKCAMKALGYFFLNYPEGDPLHDTVRDLSLLMSKLCEKEPSMLMAVGFTLSDAFEKLRKELREEDNKIEDRVFDHKIPTYSGNEALCSIEFIGEYNILRSKNGGNLREDITAFEDFGFIFVPAEFYDKCMKEPLESLCDVLRVAYKAVAYSIGLIQGDGAAVEEDANRLIRNFLRKAQCEDSSVEELMTENLRILMEKDDHTESYKRPFGIDIGGCLYQRSIGQN